MSQLLRQRSVPRSLLGLHNFMDSESTRIHFHQAIIKEGYSMKGFITFCLLAASNVCLSAETEHYSFPARASDLSSGHYWWLSGPHSGGNQAPKDSIVTKFDADSSSWVALDGSSDVHESYLIYDLPLYSPVDGEIISCWRNSPEPQDPLVGHSDTVKNGATQAGNHVNILTPDGAIVLIAHMKPDTVPAELCPIHDALLSTPDVMNGDYPAEVLLDDPATRPKVRRGQKVGHAGNSGATSKGPHLHYHIKDAEGDFQNTFYESAAWEYPLSYAWVQTTESNSPVDP
ncbi:MAG: hypothetical protein ACR2P1_13515, partial [Pseudomonadales bacterium]